MLKTTCRTILSTSRTLLLIGVGAQLTFLGEIFSPENFFDDITIEQKYRNTRYYRDTFAYINCPNITLCLPDKYFSPEFGGEGNCPSPACHSASYAYAAFAFLPILHCALFAVFANSVERIFALSTMFSLPVALSRPVARNVIWGF